MSRFLRVALCLVLSVSVTGAIAWSQTKEENDDAAKKARDDSSLPLITTRTLEFTTDEGTWISLDLSPDGETIVFELLGDLYKLPLAGGTATRITSGQAYDMQPRYSPDGLEIVFVSDRDGSENIWIAAADGTDPEALTKGERDSYMSPVWTPDGEYVIAGKGSQLWLYHRDGGSGLQITGQGEEAGAGPGPGSAPSHLGPAFSNDPRYLWVNLRGGLGGGIATGARGSISTSTSGELASSEQPWQPEFGPDHSRQYADALGENHSVARGAGPDRSSARLIGPYQIGQLDRETGRVQVRTHELEGAFRPLPSPDGRWLVYATRHDTREALKLLDVSTSEEQWLVMDTQRDESQGGGARDRDLYPGSAFTPDSSALITSFDGKIWRVDVPSGDVTPIPFTAHVEQELGPLVKFDYPIDDDQLTVSQIRGARPAPDGSRVVFSALDRLWIADLPAGRGGERRDPIAEDVAYPTLVNARRLTTSSDVEHAPVWSPDGEHIAYVTWNDIDGGDIFRVRADGSAPPERLTPTSAFFDKIAYSRDGSRIVAVRGSKMHRMRTLEDFGGHSGAAELEYVWLDADGGEPTRIAWVGSGMTQQGRNAPHFGPNPNRVYVWAGSDGLLSMRYDGTDIKTIVKVTAPSTPRSGQPPRPATPDEVLLSPDGKKALVRANRNVFMITVPPVGGEAPTVSVANSSVVPTWRLTKVGGDFIGWTDDGAVAYYSIGRSFFRHDLAMAEQVAEAEEARLEAAKAEREAKEAEKAEEEESTADSASDTDDAAAADYEDEDGAEVESDDESEDNKPIEYEPDRVDVEIVVNKDKPSGVIALRGARLITMRGEEVIASGDIVVTDNRITAIGASGEVDIPANADVRDMSGKTILPGLVDIHAHTWVAWGVHRSQVSQFLAQLAYGVTTQRDPQTSSEDIVAYSDLMEIGELIGPRLFSTGPGVFSADNIKSLDDARDVLLRYSDHFNTQTIKQYMAGDRKVRQWVIMAANELGLTPTTEDGSNFTMNLTLM